MKNKKQNGEMRRYLRYPLDFTVPDDGECHWGGIPYRFWMLLHEECPARPPMVAADPRCGSIHPNVAMSGEVCLAALRAGSGGYSAASPAAATVKQLYSLLHN